MTNNPYIDAWFVNVGHGDCTIVKFPSGRVMMVDICNSKTLDKTTRQELYESAGMGTLDYLMWQAGMGASPSMEIEEYVKRYVALLDCPIDVLKKKLPGESIWRFVLTHPDADHMEGFYRLFNQERGTIGVTCLWDTPHTKPTPEHRTTQSEQDWKEYQRVRVGLPDGPKVLNVFRDGEGEYWTVDGIRVLAPTKESVVASCDAECWNDLSYVLRITFGQSSLVLCGDAEVKALDKLAIDDKGKLKATVLKASHHGRDSGFSEAFVKECAPAYTVVSVGKAPDTDATNKYKKLSGKVVSTRQHGTIHVRLWADGTVQAYDRNGNSLTTVTSTLSGRVINI